MEPKRNEFTINDDRDELDLDLIHGFLRESYWAKDIPRETVEKSIRHSLCFGVYEGTKQVGFARVITDYATFAYLADVFILPEYRGLGLSKRLMDAILAHEELQGLRRWMLATMDAHGLYERKGFKPLAKPERFMEISRPGLYSRPAR